MVSTRNPDHSHTWILLTLVWLLVFFPAVSKISLIKVWEMQQSAFQGRQKQLKTLHPLGEMASLLQMNDWLKQQPEYPNRYVIAAPHRDDLLPLAHDSSMIRAVLYPVPVMWKPGEGGKTIIQIIPDGESCESDLCWEVP